jgi:hypothetical protein
LDKDWDSDSGLTFYSFEDIAKRPLFKAEIDTIKSKIDKLIATYHFPDKQPCGKKGCNQPHNSGWLASTTDNQETLIGSISGKEWGGVTFTTQKAQLDRQIKRNEQLKAFYETLQNSDAIFDRVHEIKTRAKGATWLDRALKKLEDNCSKELLRAIKLRAARNETTVSIDVLKTKEEIEIEETSNSGKVISLYKTEVIGNLIGLEVFNHDLRDVLMVRIYQKLKDMKQLSPTSIPTPTLNKLMKDIRAFEMLFRQAEEILAIGNTFFSTPSNFSLIKTMDKARKHNHLSQLTWFENSKDK